MANVQLKIYKSWGTDDPERAWANTYEFGGFEGDIAITNTQFGELVSAVVDAERDIHLTEVYFLRAVLSTWGRDADENDPSNFASLPLSVRGLRTIVGDAIDRNNVYFVRRAVANGNSGKIFYRGCLTENDVQSGADLKWRLSAGSALNIGGAAWTAYSGKMNTVIADGFGGELAAMALISQKGLALPTVRPVIGITPAGVRINKANHKYFDKGN